MCPITSFVRLDFFTIKSYKKTMYPLLLIGVVMAFMYSDAAVFSSIFMMGLIIISSFPFAIAEKNGIDALYSTLSLKRRNVVAGRYVFAACMCLAGVLLNLLLSAAINRLSLAGATMKEASFMLAAMTLLFSFVVSVQFPIYFKYGYTKGKLRAYIPLLLFPLAIASFGKLGIGHALDQFLTMLSENTPLLFSGVSAAALVLLTLSCAISSKLYEKREF